MRSYQLTAKLVADHVGGAVVCLDEASIGRTFRLHEDRPGAELNERVSRAGIRSEVINAPGTGDLEDELEDATITMVTIRGPLEQRAQRRDSGCGGGWTDGYDAVAERLCEALEAGNVVLVIDSPGGAVAGLQECVKTVQQAKREHGRFIFAYADESIGSAAYWIAAALADDIYVPAAGRVGSIGARAMHASMAGALKKAGVEVSQFAWPGEGKLAFAQEAPLSDVARERATREIDAIGEAFATAVMASRPGVTRKQIIKLDADSPTGIDAVKAGLADGVASLDEVIAMAITKQENDMARAEDKPEEDKDAAAEEPSDDEECETCGGEGCEECQEEDDGEDEPDDDEGEEDAKASAKPTTSSRAPKSLAALAGLQPGASTPAIISALHPLVALARHVMAETSKTTPNAARGALKAILEDASKAGRLSAKLSTERRRNNARERTDLLKKLVAANVHPRGELFVDTIDDKSGERTTKPAAIWQEMKLSTLRGYVQQKLASSSPRPGPAAPDAAKLEQLGKGVTERDRAVAQRGGYDPVRYAAARRAMFPNT